MSAVARAKAARRKSVRYGSVVIAAVVVAMLFAVTAQNGLPGYLPGVDRTELSAEFVNVEALRSGDDVRINNVRVGFVDSIRREDGVAIVEMRLNGGREVYQDATAVVAARSALGQKFIELSPGTKAAGVLPDGGRLDATRTTSPVELDTVLDALDAKTLAATRSLLRQTGGGLGGHGDDLNDATRALPDLVENLGEVSDALSKNGGSDTADLLKAADQLASTLSSQSDHLAGLVQGAGKTLEAIAVDDGDPLEQALVKAPDTLADLRATLRSLDEPLAATGEATLVLQPGADALGRATPDLRSFLRNSVKPLDKVPGVADSATPAASDLTSMLDNASPLVKQLQTAVQRAERPLQVLAPYSPEVMLFFRNGSSALQYGDESGNWLRFYILANTQAVSGVLPIRDPLMQRDAYPEPGTAHLRNTNKILGGGS